MKKILFLLSQYLMPHRIAGYCIEQIASCERPWFKNTLIKLFIYFFKVNLNEAEKTQAEDYPNFNAFFSRALKKGARPQTGTPEHFFSPVDGILGDFGVIRQDKMILAKQVYYSLRDLLGGDSLLAQKFMDGHFMTFYLSPKHYHRIHMPCSAEFRQMIGISGKFFSVSQLAMSCIENIYAKNERVVCYFETPYGALAIILIGAMFVGSIHVQSNGRVIVAKGGQQRWTIEKIYLACLDTLGHFQMGSSVIVLWSRAQLLLNEALKPNQSIQMGDVIGALAQAPL